MTRWLLVALAACAGHVEHPTLQPRPTYDELRTQCREGEGNAIGAPSANDPHAPVIVLEEVFLHGSGPPQPTVAIWADGTILFARVVGTDGDHVKYESVEGAIPKARVDELVHEVAGAVAAVPRHSDAFVHYSMDGSQVTTFMVREGGQWRSATMYGAYQEDFLAAADGTWKQPEFHYDLPPVGDTPGLRIEEGALEQVPPPKPLALAYRTLLATRPEQAHAFVPYDHDIVFFAPEPYYVKQHPAHVAWPAALPKPPLGLSPEQCQYGEGCYYRLDGSQNADAMRFKRELRASKVPPIVEVDGKQFMVNVESLYRGERAVYAILTCSGG